MATQARDRTRHDQAMVDECIRRCLDCMDACNRCAVECMTNGGGAREMIDCAKLCLVCGTAADLMSRGSEHQGAQCRVCADLCEACAKACQGGDREIMRRCAEACRCTETCRQMAA